MAPPESQEGTTTPDKLEILDHTNVIQTWLEEGRGCHVFRNQDLSSRIGHTVFLPGDKPTDSPHWAYRYEKTIHSLDECRFFKKMRVEKSWKESSAGWRAANRLAQKLETTARENDPKYPTRVALTYTVESYKMQGPDRGDGNPLDIEFRVGVVSWSCPLDREGT